MMKHLNNSINSKRGLIYKGESYSPNRIIQEVENKTKIGVEFYKSHIQFMYGNALGKNVKRGSFKEISRIVEIEREAEMLGLDKNSFET